MTLLKWKYIILLLMILTFLGLLYFGQYGFEYCTFNCSAEIRNRSLLNQDAFQKNFLVTEDFDIEDDDVLVFLHIQKTGGTYFGINLVKNLNVTPPCVCQRHKKRCNCLTRNRKIWLFSRYSTGWACGLHADWTELKACVSAKMDDKEGHHRKRIYHFITYLRDPVKRYISEWKHVARGATWQGSSLRCNGRSATSEEVPFCYETSDWHGVTLEEFLSCPHNLANNRQTRMLADLSLVNCYNKTGMSQVKRDEYILQSAKTNLKNMSFFGITEYQNYSQILFEKTFKLPFINEFAQKSRHASSPEEIEPYLERIKERNMLDIKLYEYAKRLFFSHVHAVLEET